MGKLTKIVYEKLKESFGEAVRKEHPLLPKNKGVSFKADVSVRRGENDFIFVEIEEGQPHPDTNVGKYWMYLRENPATKATLVQILGKEFSVTTNNYKSRVDLAEFIAQKIKKEYPRFEYHAKKLNRLPQEYEIKLEEIAEEVISYIRGIATADRQERGWVSRGNRAAAR